MGFIKALAARTRLFAEEVGQNLVETALIIGVVSVVLIGTITATNVDAEVSEIAKGAVCTLSGGTWQAGGAGTAGTDNGTCTP